MTGILINHSYFLTTLLIICNSITSFGVQVEVERDLSYVFIGKAEVVSLSTRSFDTIILYILFVLILCYLGFSSPFEFIWLITY